MVLVEVVVKVVIATLVGIVVKVEVGILGMDVNEEDGASAAGFTANHTPA